MCRVCRVPCRVRSCRVSDPFVGVALCGAVNVEEGLYFGTLEKGGKAGWFPSFYVVNVVK